MLPLGDLWSGQCRVEPLRPSPPAESGLRPLCNLGYARGACARFPNSPELPDAVRFTISADQPSLVRLSYVIERDHHPFAHGSLEFSKTLGAFTAPPGGENFARQAQAYLESYFRRKTEAATR